MYLVSSQIKLAPAGGGSGVWRPNEPSGMTLLATRPFSALDEDGWAIFADAAPSNTNNFDIGTDAAAPRSPSGIGRVRFPAGFTGGETPVYVGRGVVAGMNKFYTCHNIFFTAGFQNHPVGTKIIHWYINNVNRAYSFVTGDGTGGTTYPLYPWINLQQIASAYNAGAQGGQGNGTSVNLLPNQSGQTGVQLFRGQWHLFESYINIGTAGAADGTAQWWIDSVLVGSYTGIPFVTTNATIQELRWAPTYGGLGSNVVSTQYQHIDEIYVSGKA